MQCVSLLSGMCHHFAGVSSTLYIMRACEPFLRTPGSVVTAIMHFPSFFATYGLVLIFMHHLGCIINLMVLYGQLINLS